MDYQQHPGGKGLNQSLALAKAGATVWHAGKVGSEGSWLKEIMTEAGVDTRLTEIVGVPSGHANIQVTPDGQNAIVLFGGANRSITVDDVDTVLAHGEKGDYLLVQNEISCMPELLERAKAKGLKIAFNAAPITEQVLDYPLETIDIFIVNEVEGEALSGESEPDKMIETLLESYPASAVTLTLGEKGAFFADQGGTIHQPAYVVDAADTTGAGDTFTGYLLAELLRDEDIASCLTTACKAAAVCVTRRGAATSIPERQELSLIGDKT
jgi:ribokinase|tara:strand:- start:3626 stop:4429 length:804 start_codon:yes stop_codon:yes gene_type:complete